MVEGDRERERQVQGKEQFYSKTNKQTSERKEKSVSGNYRAHGPYGISTLARGWVVRWSRTHTLAEHCKPTVMEKIKNHLKLKKKKGVPVVAQWLTNPTRDHEVAGSIPACSVG